MICDRYYYSKLNGDEKNAYKMIYATLQKHEQSVAMKWITNESLLKVFEAINLDNPHLFFVDFSSIARYDLIGKTTVELSYLYDKSKTITLTQRINAICTKILLKVTGKTDYEKEASLHDILVRNVLYDNVAKSNVKKFRARSNTILGVLFYKTAVCEGIAKIFKLLLNALNIKCLVVKGETLGNENSELFHAWNIVKIDGKPYHVDLTWDINLSDKKICRHDYLNLPDNDITRDHKFGTDYPVCSFTNSNYFYKNNLIVNSDKDIERIIRNAIRLKHNAVEFKLNDSAIEATTDIMAIAGNCIKKAARCQRNLSLSGTCPTEQGVCYIEWFH